MWNDARYPVRLEVFRLVPLGDPPYYDEDEARSHFEAGRPLSVLSAAEPPPWSLHVSQDRSRLTAKYVTASGTPLRIATWERRGGGLLCARTIDLFYPDGDPGGFVPYSEVVSVTRLLYADGVADVTVTTPIDVYESHVLEHVPVAESRLRMPEFGDWEPLLKAGEPSHVDRCGLEALDAAFALAKRWRTSGTAAATSAGDLRAGWRTPLSPTHIREAVGEIAEGRPPAGIHVIRRGTATIVPLLVQADLSAPDRDPVEESHRSRDLASAMRSLFEFHGGYGIGVRPDEGQTNSVTSYAAALESAGATRADWWEHGRSHAMVLVHAGDERAGTLTLALHVVPISWVHDRRAKASAGSIDIAWSKSDLHPTEG